MYAIVTAVSQGMNLRATCVRAGLLLSGSELHAGKVLFLTGLGLLLGIRHSTDADHIVALATIVSRQRSIARASWIGVLWGLGHTITVFLVGCLIILFHVQIPMRLGLLMEFCVAVMLVLLGVLNLTGVMPDFANRFAPALIHAESHKERKPHLHRLQDARLLNAHLRLFHTLRPLLIGLVHGLAGSAAVALLVLATIPQPVWAALYLVVFGSGTMIGMVLMTTLFAVSLRHGSRFFSRLSESLGFISGCVSLCFGAFLMYQLGFVDGLFTNHPQWTPQ